MNYLRVPKLAVFASHSTLCVFISDGGLKKTVHHIDGTNSRLDAMPPAILIAKLMLKATGQKIESN